MRTAALSLFVVSTALTLAAVDPRRASAAGGSSPEHEADWKHFTIKDIQIGMEISKLQGFTCGPHVGQYTCVKFLDPKCNGRPTKVKPISFMADIPQGQSCFFDSSGDSTYLDRKMTPVKLSFIAVRGTDTRVPRVYDIEYTFAYDRLTDGSNIGKALVAKYGPPTNESPPTAMGWFGKQIRLDAQCGMSDGPAGQYCSLQTSDGEFLTTERSIDQAAKDAAADKAAPPAPKL